MKNIYILIATSFLIISCVDSGKCNDDNGTLVNNSGKNIIITSYRNHSLIVPPGTISKTISMLNNSSITKRDEQCPPSSADVSFGDLVEGDSIVIDYGDKKKGYGNRINTNRNPYYLDGLANSEQDFTYTLIPEDYANAIPK